MGAPVRFGVIFDNDGVLVDSEQISLAAWREAMHEQGVEPRQEDDWQYCGLTDADILHAMRTAYGPALDLERFSTRVKQLYFELAQRCPLRPFPGVRELASALQAAGVPYVVASSGSRKKILFNLRSAGLDSLFPVVVSGEDFQRGKPDPEIFLRAAETIAVAPHHCAVFEDSINGLKAAHAAGCLAIGVTNTFPAQRLHPYADLIISSLTEVSVAQLEQWLSSHVLKVQTAP